MRAVEWEQDKLFDAWNITYDWQPKTLTWPDEMADFDTTDKERWGILTAKNAIFRAMPSARVSFRGDAIVWDEGQGGYHLVGDIDVAWEGRSPIVEVKAYLPAVRLRGGRAPACQGLDWPQRQNYLNEQERTGRPFYVLWIWPDLTTRTRIVRGQRVDLLAWPPREESLNRNRKTKGAKMAYWYIDELLTVAEIAADIESWTGAPFQEPLFA